MKRFENKVIVITGGASGIGAAAAEKFLSEGASVAVWDMKENSGSMQEEVAANSRYKFFKVNVADFNEVERATTLTL